MKKMSKKGAGAFGFDEASTALVALLVLVTIGVLAIIVFNSLGQASPATTANQYTVLNEVGWLNGTNYTLKTAGGLQYTITGAVNYTNGSTIATTYYTVNSVTGVVSNASVANWNNVTYNYTYWLNNGYNSNIINNTTSGFSTFFGNVGTWLTLLSVTIIVLIIVTVIVVLRRGGEQAQGSSGMGGSSGGSRSVPDL